MGSLRNKLTEKEIKNLVKNAINESNDTEINEILGLDNMYHGLRGMYQGEGYDYFRFLNKLKNRSGYLSYALDFAQNEFEYLKSLYEKIKNSNFNPDRKNPLLTLIEPIITGWETSVMPISSSVKEINQMVSDKLTNKIDYLEPKREPKSKSKKNRNDDFTTTTTTIVQTNNNSEEETNPETIQNMYDFLKNKPKNNVTTTTTTTASPMNPNQRNIGDDLDSNTPRWDDDTIKEEIKRFKNLIK